MYACVMAPLDIHVEWDHSTSHSTFSLDVRRLLWPHDRCKIFWNHNGSAALAYKPALDVRKSAIVWALFPSGAQIHTARGAEDWREL